MLTGPRPTVEREAGSENAGVMNRLSLPEREVLELITAGNSLEQIGARMGVSADTVEIYCNRIMVKLEIYDLARLVRFALDFSSRSRLARRAPTTQR